MYQKQARDTKEKGEFELSDRILKKLLNQN